MRAPTFVVIAAVIAAPSAFATGPYAVRMTYAGDPSTSMAVSWNSDDANDKELRFGHRVHVGVVDGDER